MRARFCCILALGTALPLLAQNARNTADPVGFPYRDLTHELANKTTGSFVIAATGDLLIQEPIGKTIDPKIQAVLRSADTTVGNLEVTLVDRRNWPHGLYQNWSPKETAADLKALGFDLLTGANNHSWDMGIEGMQSTVKWLDEQGIPLAGIGPNLATARLPAFHYTDKGRVAMIGAFAVAPGGYPGIGPAQDRDGILGHESWGFNPLRVTPWTVVTESQMEQLKAIRDSMMARRNDPDVARPIDMPRDPPGRLQIATANYMVGPKPGEFRYEMNRGDREGNVLAMRNAKEYADFAIFTMHVHQNRYVFQADAQDHYPTQFLIDFTHELIDNGADMYVGHGNHTIQGVEIYKGRPIFYNLGNFAVHEIQPAAEAPPGMTGVEADELSTDRLQQPDNMVALVASSRYQDGRLQEVRLYPVDLGVGKNRPWSRMSIAQTPSPALAQDILSKVQKYSEPFGTRIAIENGIGVIRVAADATVPVGAGIRERLKR